MDLNDWEYGCVIAFRAMHKIPFCCTVHRSYGKANTAWEMNCFQKAFEEAATGLL